MSRVIFGPVNSRRFGLSLGIDLSPSSKSCNFDCLYCELSTSKVTDKITEPPSVDEVIESVEEALKNEPNIDVITITANGEPTLYPHLKELVQKLSQIKGDKKLLILSNASTIFDESVQEALMGIDIVKLSLDCATQSCFKKLDRPIKGIEIAEIIEGIKSFRERFDGELVIEVLVVKGVNDAIEEMREINLVLNEIEPHRVDLGTIDRPPAYAVEGVSEERLRELAEAFEGVALSIITKKPPQVKIDLSKERLLETIKLRPQSEMDVDMLYSVSTKALLEELVGSGEVVAEDRAGVKFYISKDRRERRR